MPPDDSVAKGDDAVAVAAAAGDVAEGTLDCTTDGAVTDGACAGDVAGGTDGCCTAGG